MTDVPQSPEAGKQPEPERKNYEIHVNRKPFPWPTEFIKGSEVLGLVGEDPANYSAYIKVQKGDDIPVPADQEVDLKDEKNRQFITIPNRSTEG